MNRVKITLNQDGRNALWAGIRRDSLNLVRIDCSTENGEHSAFMVEHHGFKYLCVMHNGNVTDLECLGKIIERKG